MKLNLVASVSQFFEARCDKALPEPFRRMHRSDRKAHQAGHDRDTAAEFRKSLAAYKKLGGYNVTPAKHAIVQKVIKMNHSAVLFSRKQNRLAKQAAGKGIYALNKSEAVDPTIRDKRIARLKRVAAKATGARKDKLKEIISKHRIPGQVTTQSAGKVTFKKDGGFGRRSTVHGHLARLRGYMHNPGATMHIAKPTPAGKTRWYSLP